MRDIPRVNAARNLWERIARRRGGSGVLEVGSVVPSARPSRREWRERVVRRR